jgi:hypothetical protein
MSVTKITEKTNFQSRCINKSLVLDSRYINTKFSINDNSTYWCIVQSCKKNEKYVSSLKKKESFRGIAQFRVS